MNYSVDLEDLKFVLFEQLDIDTDLARIPKYQDFDQETYTSMIEEGSRLAAEVLSPINGPGDREGCHFDPETNTVRTPEGFKAAWDTLAEGGWISVTAPQEAGGLGGPAVLGMAMNEMFSGAAMAFQMYPGLTAAAARVLHRYGPEGMSTNYAERMFAGEWAGTMCLTEAGAGSSVGDNRARATAVDGVSGAYHLEGEKIFISGGDHDLAENILHLVLARTPTAPAGTKGLSLFLVPKFLINEDGSLADRNDARVVGIEHKMGINGSATCTLALGSQGDCMGWLVGEECRGIEIMFTMMNEARIGVGLQGLAMAASAYQYALTYARDRVQGTSLADFKNADAPRVSILQHPDVRRMMLSMKCQVEAMRSMCMRLGHQLDVAEHDDTLDDAARQRLKNRVDLLVPVLKSHCSDAGYEVCVTALQVFGGYGYIGEYPIEQNVRDMKITSIYEGTNGIQAMDLLGRKMRTRNGALFMEWVQDAQTMCQEHAETFPTETQAIGKAVGAVGAAAMHLAQVGMTSGIDSAMLQAVPFQRMLGTAVLALEALDQAAVAHRLIAANGETPHLAGKLLNLRFYVHNILPTAVALGKGIQSSDESCLDPRLFA